MDQRTDEGACRLVELRAENFLRLHAVDIRPGGQVVEITGANSHGKTSVLRAFWAALRGKAALADVAPVAIHRGADAGGLFLDLGRIKITRTITKTEDGTEEWSLKLVAGDRRIATKPQAMLDAIAGPGLVLDPLEFARWGEQGVEGRRKQAGVIEWLVPGFDFERNAKDRAGAYAERTDVTREKRREEAAASSVVLPDGPEPAAVAVTDMLRGLEDAERGNAAVEQRRERRRAVQADADQKRDEAERLRSRANTLDREADDLEAKLKDAAPLPAIMDLAPLRAKIADADRTRAARDAFQRQRAHREAAATHAKREAALSAQIEALDKARAGAIAAAKLPAPGLSLGDGEVLLNDLPFSQAATSEKIKASMAIAMATAGDLHVVMIDEGSELDSKSLAVVEDMVRGTDFVVLVCRVDESGERGWVIQDGRVARAPKAKGEKK